MRQITLKGGEVVSAAEWRKCMEWYEDCEDMGLDPCALEPPRMEFDKALSWKRWSQHRRNNRSGYNKPKTFIGWPAK